MLILFKRHFSQERNVHTRFQFFLRMHAGIEQRADINPQGRQHNPRQQSNQRYLHLLGCYRQVHTFCRIYDAAIALRNGKLELIFLFFIQQKQIQFFLYLLLPFYAYHILQLSRHECYLIAVLPLLVLHIRHLYLQTCYQVIHSFCDRQAHGHQRTVQVTHERIIGTTVGYQLVPARQHRVVLHNQVLHSHIIYPDTCRDRLCRLRVILQVFLHILRHIKLIFHA